MTARASILDDVLSGQSEYGPEYGSALSSHVPMVLEALDRLGRVDRLEAHLERWIPRLRRLSPETDPDLGLYAGTLALATVAVERFGPRGAVRALSPQWAPGVHGAAFHGLLRLAHAVRGMDRADTQSRRAELSRGLAYAVVRAAQPLPSHPWLGDHGDRLDRGIAGIEASAKAGEARTGLITADLLKRLGTGDLLADAVARVSLPCEPSEAVHALRRASLILFVDGERHPSASFALLHGVTGVDAVAALVPWLHVGTAQDLTRAMGASLLALRIAFVPRVRPREVLPPRDLEAALIARAVESGDAHAIKLAAACVEGARAVPDAPWNEALAAGLARLTSPFSRP